MSSVSSPLGTFFQQAYSPPAADQNSPAQRLQPAEQQTPAPVDTVTLSGYFSGLSQTNSPAPPAQPAAVTLGGSSNTSTSNPAPAAAAATAVASQNPAPDPAPATGSGALPPAVQGASSPINGSPAAQQQQLAQLDQILQQLGIDPASIPVSEQLSMVLYLDDPAALAQLVQSLGQVVQIAHLKGLGGTRATQPQNPDQLKSAPTETALAPAAGAAQNAPASAPNENPTAAAQPQIAALATAPAAAQAAASAGNAASAANAPSPASPAANGFAAQFQELQVSLQALGANNFAPAATGAALNVVA